MEGKQKNLTKKLQLLKLTLNKTSAVVEKGNLQAISRHRDALVHIVGEADGLKRVVEEAKLDADESEEAVAEWALGIEEEIGKADSGIDNLSKYLADVERDASDKRKEKENMDTAREREDLLRFEQEKYELQQELNQKAERTGKITQKDQVKLPKLVITKFNGTHEQWLSFWNKFEAEIDGADIAPVTKFAYLKELVEPKVKEDIDGLPFTNDGYIRAKAILKDEYGKVSEIVHAYVRNIAALPKITGSQPSKVHQFHKTLMYNVQSLETLGRLQEVKGNVRSVIEKLEGIKADLVRGEENWQEWDFTQLLVALRKWKDIHPVEERETPPDKRQHSRNRSFYAQDHGQPHKVCVFCESSNHNSVNCDQFTSVADRKKKISEKRLCFNCTRSKHRAAECKSKSVCQVCKRKHHTSICDKVSEDMMKTARNKVSAVCHPVVVIEVNGIKCRALLDTGAGSSYASAALLDKLRLKPERSEVRRIEMMIGATTKRVEIYSLQISSVKGDFKLEAEVTKVDRKELLTVRNPKYNEMIRRYGHLQGVVMEDTDNRDELPVHVILGASEYTKIKTASNQKVGRIGEPVAEKTRFGWTIMTSGAEDVGVGTKIFLTQTSVTDYDELCRLDVLGLEDSPTGDQETVYAEFREQLKRSDEGWYETGLPWKGNHPSLPSNEKGSLRRLNTLVHKLERSNLLSSYDEIIQDQLAKGVVERVTEPAAGVKFYLPHKAVVRESAATTKLRIVYDASAREHQQSPSLNECLEVGPPLQNHIWKVLVRGRFHPVAVTGDLKQAFLQVRIRKEDRDVLRFHWFADLQYKNIVTLRFTRALFGLAPSPFLLGGVIQQHLEKSRSDHPEAVAEIVRSMYVDDLVTGGATVKEANEIKKAAIEIFEKAKFELHKWDRTLESWSRPLKKSKKRGEATRRNNSAQFPEKVVYWVLCGTNGKTPSE